MPWSFISISRDVTVCGKVTLVILHGMGDNIPRPTGECWSTLFTCCVVKLCTRMLRRNSFSIISEMGSELVTQRMIKQKKKIRANLAPNCSKGMKIRTRVRSFADVYR